MPRLYEESPDFEEFGIEIMHVDGYGPEEDLPKKRRQKTVEQEQRDAKWRAAAEEREVKAAQKKLRMARERLMLNVFFSVRDSMPSLECDVFEDNIGMHCVLYFPRPDTPTHIFSAPENPWQFQNAYVGSQVCAAIEQLKR